MWLIVNLFFFLFLSGEAVYTCSKGNVNFESNTALETIKAESHSLRGVLNPVTHQFSFAVQFASFNGFNSPLQKEHFHENYVESTDYPEVKFSGRVIEEIDFQKKGIYKVRAKGFFQLHGITNDVIIHSQLIVQSATEINIESDFIINLPDYQIKIPRLVHKKLAETISVHVNCTLTKS